VTLGRKGRPAQVEFSGKQIVDETKHYALSDSVPVEDIDKAMLNRRLAGVEVDPVADAARGCAHLLALAREKRTADLVFNADSYHADFRLALANGNRFDDAATDVWGLLQTAKSKLFHRPNIIVFGQEAWNKFCVHPKVLKAVHGNDGDAGLASEMAVGKILGIPKVLIGASRADSAAEGQAENLGRLWGKSVAMLYVDSADKMARNGGMKIGDRMNQGGTYKRPSFGFTAVYEPLSVYSQFNARMGIKGGHEIDVKESCKEVVSGKNGYGYYFSTVVD